METKKNIERHLNVLCKEISARPTGSEANHTAVEYACREFKRAGLDVLRQEFDCMDWVENGGVKAVLTVSLSPERFVPVIEDGDFEVPCAMVLPESLPQLCSRLPAALTLNTERRPAKVANIIAVYGSGKHKPELFTKHW